CDVERAQRRRKALADDQRLVVGCHRHAVGESDPLCDDPHFAIRRHQPDMPGPELAAWKVEIDVVEIDVAAAVDDDLVPAELAIAGEVDPRRTNAVLVAPP